jgi:hypothetical protein
MIAEQAVAGKREPFIVRIRSARLVSVGRTY